MANTHTLTHTHTDVHVRSTYVLLVTYVYINSFMFKMVMVLCDRFCYHYNNMQAFENTQNIRTGIITITASAPRHFD